MPQLYTIFINAQSGSVLNAGVEEIERIIKDSGIGLKGLHILPAAQFFEKLEAYDDFDTPILIGGGDGTINSAARIMSDKNIAFGILPLGTMNLLAHDFHIPVPFQDSIEAYVNGYMQVFMDRAYVNNELFLCSAAVGLVPESAEFREEHRAQSAPILFPRLTVFILEQLDCKYQRRYKMSVDGRSHMVRSASIVVSNNEYDQSENIVESSLRRSSLLDGCMGVYSAAPTNSWDKVRLLLKMQFGGWRQDTVMRAWKAETLSLDAGADEELVAVDGEAKFLKSPLNFWVKPKSLEILVPKGGVV